MRADFTPFFFDKGGVKNVCYIALDADYGAELYTLYVYVKPNSVVAIMINNNNMYDYKTRRLRR